MFLYSTSISEDFLAMAKIGIKLNQIPEGRSSSLKWNDKPLCIRHCDSTLLIKEPDETLVKKSEWLVVIGLCRNLGSVPTDNFEDFGDYYCPCHGFHYDASRRFSKDSERVNLKELLQEIFGPPRK